MKKVIGAVILLLAALGGGMLWQTHHKEEVAGTTKPGVPKDENHVHLTPEQMQQFGIQLEKVEPGKLSIQLSTRGKITLHPDRLAHVLPKVSGVAKEGRKNIGDSVQEGDILAIVESREMADIKANYLAALEKEKLAESMFERERRLHEKKISAEQDFINANSNLEEAKINLLLAKQKLHAFGLDEKAIAAIANESKPDLRIYEIRAPISGVIINRHITQGEFIDNTMPIFEIADLSRVWIEIAVFPKDLAKVKKGQKVLVKLPFGTKSQTAEIFYVSPIVQEETITSKAVAEMRNPTDEWRPGTFVTVDVDTENVDAPLVVSNEAIQEIDGKKVVFVKSGEGFEKRVVETGRADNSFVEIVSGLKSGEEVVSAKTFLLKAELGKGDVDDDD